MVANKKLLQDCLPVYGKNLNNGPDLICLSHLRWDFVYQRPQHLLSRFARDRRVFFFEEPVYEDGPMRLDVSQRDCGVYIVVPRLPKNSLRDEELDTVLLGMIDNLFMEYEINEHVLWYYTPMAVGWTQHLKPLAVVYDCMDELSAFKFAPRELKAREAELFNRADLVFTGGMSLYEAKRNQHSNVFPFPSSIDAMHFAQARSIRDEPEDQSTIPHPRLGFFGVIDERMNLELIASIADARPDWHLVMIGPIVKIDPADLPVRDNMHYLGSKDYKDLPAYLAGWDVALLPFARNESTRFISPTKTPEYLAAGCPVVSTSIQDVVRPYGQLGLVHVADVAEEFVAACERAMTEERASRLVEVDAFLARTSWDRTWGRMNELIEDIVEARRARKESVRLRRFEAARASSAPEFATAGD
ncbi:MAG TPA: glycosyltransferase family 1 protein [Pyrinomonadaceae bacterium]|nr:glycosyltransferase family 1 protein [Pyrinomonadaceae bacterium]